MNLLFISYFIGAIIGALVVYILCWAFGQGQKQKEQAEVKIKYFVDEHGLGLEHGSGGLEWVDYSPKGDLIDLYAAEDVNLKAGERKKIPLGVGMILPKGYEAHLYSRSSTAENFGIAMDNSVGIIDNSYCGDNDEWQYPAIALRDTHISRGDKICQFRIVKNQPRLFFKVVDHLKDKDRGGFGTTGRRA